jgi:hypothetical protein
MLFVTILSLVPNPIINLQILSSDLLPLSVIATLTWEPPVGTGPEAIVDYYSVHILPQPLSHSQVNNVTLLSLRVTLEYSRNYTVAIYSVNCAGSSISTVLNDVNFGMHR